MKKSDRIAAFVGTLNVAAGHDPRYRGYFACFNAAQYYEAHDVLEDLWLACEGADADFFKGLIQFAGAFVHLQKQHARPDHPKDGRRLHPAVRLFRLAEGNLRRFGPARMGLDVAAVCGMCHRYAEEIAAADFTVNPWQPACVPRLELA